MEKDYRTYLPQLLKLTIFILAVLFLYFFGVRLLLIVFPFFIGWVIALMIEPLTRVMEAKLKIGRKWSSLLGILLLVIAVLGMTAILSTVAVIQAISLSENLPQYMNTLYKGGRELFIQLEGYYNLIPNSLGERLLSAADTLIQYFTAFLSGFLTSFISVLTTVPQLIVFMVVAIFSGYFISVDRKEITEFIMLQIPVSWLPKLKIIREDLFVAAGGYIKAQLILMFFTFLLSLFGLWLIGLEYAFLIALIASVLDALPILGTGIVYVPIVIWQAVQGNYMMAFSVALVNFAAVLLRRFIEPKVLANQIGFHPLSILIFMYAGLRLSGFAGMILGPIFLIICLALQRAEILPQWRKKVNQEEEKK